METVAGALLVVAAQAIKPKLARRLSQRFRPALRQLALLVCPIGFVVASAICLAFAADVL